MIEIPEALVLAKQINETIKGKKIVKVTTECTPHKFAWFNGDSKEYENILVGKTISKARGIAGLVEIKVEDTYILIGDGASFRYVDKGKQKPKKHQLLIDFEDGAAAYSSVQMYGGIWCFKENEFENQYYEIAKQKPSPLSEAFDKEYFDKLISNKEYEKLSAKAFLATEQRIPGLGNGVLQDILWRAKIHPRRKLNSLKTEERDTLFGMIKCVLLEMTEEGGRDTEKNFFGENGSYKTMMSKNNVGGSCRYCDASIIKENYLGGSIYYCKACQDF